MKYKKKPIVIEAIEWTGKNLREIQSFIEGHKIVTNDKHWDDYEDIVSKSGLAIHTLEGDMKASIGDYIIKGINGEFYPCKPDIFKKTYEEPNSNVFNIDITESNIIELLCNAALGQVLSDNSGLSFKDITEDREDDNCHYKDFYQGEFNSAYDDMEELLTLKPK